MDTKATTNTPGGEPRPTERMSSEETVRLGKEIYERDIRHQVEADHVGKIVAIDVDSGNWAMGDEVLVAAERLRAKRPEARQRLLREGRLPDCRQHRGRAPAENRLIEGIVSARYEAVITISIHGPAERMREVDAVIDTGYSEYLMLPPTIVTELDLPLVSINQALLADGSEVSL